MARCHVSLVHPSTHAHLQYHLRDVANRSIARVTIDSANCGPTKINVGWYLKMCAHNLPAQIAFLGFHTKLREEAPD